MDKKTTLAALAFCLATGRAFGASSEIDLKTLQLLKEEGVSTEEFERAFLGKHAPGAQPKSLGNYSDFSVSDGNYSDFSISDANYSDFSISDGNYSDFSISAQNYSDFSLSGDAVTVSSNHPIPAPQVKKNDKASN